LTGFLSQDHFNLNNDTTYAYGNKNVSLKWKHIFNNRFYNTVAAGYDRYQYSIGSQENPANAYKLGFDINQLYLRTYFNYLLNSSHTLEFGFSTLRYKLHPGYYVPVGPKSLVVPDTLQTEHAQESALYLSDRYTITNDLSLEAGIRYSLFNYLGPSAVNNYAPGYPETVETQTGVTNYPSIKAGYNTQRQYIHMLSNTTAEAPTDIWKLSDPNIRPQSGDQWSLGAYKDFKHNTIETSLEVYYKDIDDYLDYRSGAQLIMNHHIETDVLETKGKAYGAELLIKKLTG